MFYSLEHVIVVALDLLAGARGHVVEGDHQIGTPGALTRRRTLKDFLKTPRKNSLRTNNGRNILFWYSEVRSLNLSLNGEARSKDVVFPTNWGNYTANNISPCQSQKRRDDVTSDEQRNGDIDNPTSRPTGDGRMNSAVAAK
ncbi:hypothetical protein AAG570_011044 [Ranatra chinensis]|uniref:Secreted protein n=1 Tax=Ranatra chinensis TaxID=642074 RepID=A0ABD0YVP6_9HEMI